MPLQYTQRGNCAGDWISSLHRVKPEIHIVPYLFDITLTGCVDDTANGRSLVIKGKRIYIRVGHVGNSTGLVIHTVASQL